MNQSDQTPYLRRLTAERERIQPALESLLESYRVQPVGSGFIDLILPLDAAVRLIGELEAMGIAIERVTWWCHCTPESRLALGCHHGMGGPRARFDEGWFSEEAAPDLDLLDHGVDFDDPEVEPAALVRRCGALARTYIERDLPVSPVYLPCLYAGLWLHVPDDWTRERYFLDA